MFSFIILTHNGLDRTRALVESIQSYAGTSDYELIFVDDGSTDGTVEYVQTLPPATLVPFAQERFNYYAARNAGGQVASGEFLAFLNNDIEIWTPGFVPLVSEILRRNRLIGLLSPEEVSKDDPGRWRGVETDGEFYFPGRPLGPHIQWPWGAGCFLRREVWEQMGGFDESYTGYGYEEAELGLTLLKAGLRVADVQVKVIHNHDHSLTNLNWHNRERLVENCLRFQEKHGWDLNFDLARPDLMETMMAYLQCVFLYEWQRRHTSLDLGSNGRAPEGYVSIDRVLKGNVDLVWDLSRDIPWPDSTVDEVRAWNFLEHVPAIPIINEIYRVLKPGGILYVFAPSTEGQAAWGDPTHVSFWNEMTFSYFTVDGYLPDIAENYGITCQFRKLKLTTSQVAGYPYVEAILQAVKEPISVPPVPTYWVRIGQQSTSSQVEEMVGRLALFLSGKEVNHVCSGGSGC